MFLRKLTVIAVPLLLAAALCMVLPGLGGLGFGSGVLKGLLLGVGLALLLPLSGAGKKREPFAGLLWVPALVMALVVLYQYMHSTGALSWPLMAPLTTRDGQVVLVECAFVGYMAVQCARTRR